MKDDTGSAVLADTEQEVGGLLPCPFCGGRGDFYADCGIAYCTKCDAQNENGVKAWNTRAPTSRDGSEKT